MVNPVKYSLKTKHGTYSVRIFPSWPGYKVYFKGKEVVSGLQDIKSKRWVEPHGMFYSTIKRAKEGITKHMIVNKKKIGFDFRAFDEIIGNT